ncbi:MAG TPA: glycoside hydrolase family 15 protein [Pyrinomonadaceae bacterium]|nr:glycoside hydrolase family 15 protein [Pyrinomonadaceae bacterium]
MNRAPSLLLIIVFTAVISFPQATKPVAPGGPGGDAHWLTAAKNGFGTSNTLTSKVWFTLADGVLTEVYYPTLDTPNVQVLQLLVVGSKVATEVDDTNHRLEIVDANSLSFRQVNSAKNGNYTISKTYLTDPQRNTLLIDIKVKSRSKEKIYVYYDPSLNNSGRHDSGWFEDGALLAVDGDKASALISSSGFAHHNDLPGARADQMEVSTGYLGTSDGLTELRNNRGLTPSRAGDGNVVQVASLKGLQGFQNVNSHCTLALGFGKTPQAALANARASLKKGFARIQREYQSGWHNFSSRLPRVEKQYQRQFNMAALVLRALEDKTFRGATIASPSIPWGGGPNANEPTVSGYHAVWSRDLYHIATALLAMGDRAAANRALDYLLNVQQKPDGSFPQSSRVDGQAIGGGLQMDQVALPLVLAFQLGRSDSGTWRKHLKPAADFILQHGPATGQDRWEEKPGYSPATIAAEIAGLVCAAQIARLHDDRLSAERYLATADQWAKEVEHWTVTSTGQGGQGSHYLRISENNDPNDGATIEINSGGGNYDEREIVDAGFLELVRLGVKSPKDPLILRSLELVDRLIKIETPHGAAWYRYNHDAYGERADGSAYDGRTGSGRLWTLLSGERGEFELARGNRKATREYLLAMSGFANEGMMIPEQVWDRSAGEARCGTGTGSATPLAWSMAQFIRLLLNVKSGRNLETPSVILERYVKR